MCRFTPAEYDLYRRPSLGPDRPSAKSERLGEKPGRSLFEWLRELWRPRPPAVAEAEVVPFPAETTARADQETDRRRSRAA